MWQSFVLDFDKCVDIKMKGRCCKILIPVDFRWIFGVFSVENILVFGGKSPERVPPDVLCNTLKIC